MEGKRRSRGFTLVEMLIVIVIIGILSAALIPRISGTQARARDTTRAAHLRDLSTALMLYATEHDGTYPLAYPSFPTLSETDGSTAVLGGLLSGYIESIPQDPTGAGISTSIIDGSCVQGGTHYSYHTKHNKFVLTATMESEKGNAINCKGGAFEKKRHPYLAVGDGVIVESGCMITDNTFVGRRTAPNAVSLNNTTTDENIEYDIRWSLRSNATNTYPQKDTDSDSEAGLVGKFIGETFPFVESPDEYSSYYYAIRKHCNDGTVSERSRQYIMPTYTTNPQSPDDNLAY